jgi:hypothetical protein
MKLEERTNLLQVRVGFSYARVPGSLISIYNLKQAEI